MKLNDVKEGEVYAYIFDYDPHRDHCSGNSNPVKVLKKEKRVLDLGKDDCGRPIQQTKTVLDVKRYHIAATDPMALNLDEFEKYDSNRVESFTITRGARDLVWEWEKEVEQLRGRAIHVARAKQRVAYQEGMYYRVLRWMLEKYRKTMLEVHKLRVRQAGVHIPYKAWITSYQLGQAIFDWLDKGETTLSFGAEVTLTVGDEYLHRSYSHTNGIYADAGIHLRYAMKMSFSDYVFSLLREEPSPIYEEFLHKGNSYFQYLVREKEIDFLAMIDGYLNFYREKIEEQFGKRIAKFVEGSRNWESWNAAEKADCEARYKEVVEEIRKATGETS